MILTLILEQVWQLTSPPVEREPVLLAVRINYTSLSICRVSVNLNPSSTLSDILIPIRHAIICLCLKFLKSPLLGFTRVIYPSDYYYPLNLRLNQSEQNNCAYPVVSLSRSPLVSVSTRPPHCTLFVSRTWKTWIVLELLSRTLSASSSRSLSRTFYFPPSFSFIQPHFHVMT